MIENVAKTTAADALVIGGGPAGLFLAARLAALLPGSGSGRVLVLEKMPAPGRKLLASGSGQCNISHEGPIRDFLDRYGPAGRFFKKSLYAFSNEDLAAWFAERGIELEAEEGGKLFPASRKASDILRALTDECEARGVSLLTGKRVLALGLGQGLSSETAFTARTEGGESFGAPLLAIATGGSSYPGTGSSGEGLALAKALGHSIVPPRPALTPISLVDRSLCSLSGLSFSEIPFVQRRGGKKLGSFTGDVLITHEGLSGPGILDASRGFKPGDRLELDFAGNGLEVFQAEFAYLVAASHRNLARSVLAEAGLPRRLAELILKLCHVDQELRCAQLRRESREAMALMAAAFPVEIAALGGFDKAMVTAGGVDLSEVDGATMASRLVSGLYFAGEVLDYDGDTGGFNLQAAFSTADAAARAMAASRN